MSTNEQIGLGIDDAKEKAEELIKRRDVEDTPFTVITQEGKSFGVMGEYRITEPEEDPDVVYLELQGLSWNRITQVMMILLEKQEALKELRREED